MERAITIIVNSLVWIFAVTLQILVTGFTHCVVCFVDIMEAIKEISKGWFEATKENKNIITELREQLRD